MSLHRYQVLDAYTLEELKRLYQSSDKYGRIKLLKKLYRENIHSTSPLFSNIPYEINMLAVKDEFVEVRQWIARNGKNLDDEQKDFLRHDPDQFIRACFYENPICFNSLFVSDWKEMFLKTNHLERLALYRNSATRWEMVTKLFDITDKDLAISIKERRELILAYLTNKEAIKASKRGGDYYSDGLDEYTVTSYFKELWTLITKWPKESDDLKYFVYLYIDTDDSTKAQTYKSCENSELRQAILGGCNPQKYLWHNFKETIELGMKDSDETCRELAYSKIKGVSSKLLENTLKGEDKAALTGLACNTSLSAENIEAIRVRLSELDDGYGS